MILRGNFWFYQRYCYLFFSFPLAININNCILSVLYYIEKRGHHELSIHYQIYRDQNCHLGIDNIPKAGGWAINDNKLQPSGTQLKAHVDSYNSGSRLKFQPIIGHLYSGLCRFNLAILCIKQTMCIVLILMYTTFCNISYGFCN